MKIITTILITWITFTACRYQQQQRKESNAIYRTAFPTIDSLEKYLGKDSLFTSLTYKYYVGKLNEVDYAFVQNTDTTTIQYQRLDGKWIRQDSFAVPLYLVQTADLNGDKLKDLILTYNVTAAGGNSENISLLYLPEQKNFAHNRFFDLPNISYDSFTDLIHSTWWGSSNHLQEKRLYKINSDSLIIIRGVNYEPDEKMMGRLAKIHFFTIKDNEKVVEREEKGNADKLFNLFHRTLWNTNGEF